MDSLAAAFPGQGSATGADQPPAFVTGKVARSAYLSDCWSCSEMPYVAFAGACKAGWTLFGSR